jgi:hypothetical protein
MAASGAMTTKEQCQPMKEDKDNCKDNGCLLVQGKRYDSRYIRDTQRHRERYRDTQRDTHKRHRDNCDVV